MSDRILDFQPSVEKLRSSERRAPERGISRAAPEIFPREEREAPVRSIKRAKSGEKLRKAERY